MISGESVYEALRKAIRLNVESEDVVIGAALRLLKDCRTIFYFGASETEESAMLAACGVTGHGVERLGHDAHDAFFLPQDPCAIEDHNGVVIVRDDAGPVGLAEMRFVLTAARIPVDSGTHYSRLLRGYVGAAIFAVMARYRYMPQGKHETYLAGCLMLPRHANACLVLDAEQAEAAEADAKAYGDVGLAELVATRTAKAIQEIVAINSPANIVVQHTAPMVRLRDGREVPARPGKVPRGSKRTTRIRYLVLPKRKAHMVVTGSSERESIERCPHLRRRHLRHLGSERFTNKRGETVIVREAWIGAKERRLDDGTIYRVVLDMGHERWSRAAATTLERTALEVKSS